MPQDHAVTETELFLHSRGAKPKVVMAALDAALHQIIDEHGLAGGGDLFVFVGECEEALGRPLETDNGCDDHEPVDVTLTVAVLELNRHRHIHVHHCRHIAVDVTFNGNDKRHKFAPNTTVEVVAEWARRKFRLDPTAAKEFVLQISGTTTQPRADQHLGDLVVADTCSVSFTLVKELTPQG
jgi:hypothetical protein